MRPTADALDQHVGVEVPWAQAAWKREEDGRDGRSSEPSA